MTTRVRAIISISVAVMLTVVLFSNVIAPIINEDKPSYWQYDDYRDSNGIDTVDGALEIVTLGGKSLVHAKSTGDATITYTDGHLENVTVRKAELDLYLFYGQSNAAYTQPNPSLSAPVPKLGTSYYFGFSNNPIHKKTDIDRLDDCKMWSVTKDDGTARIGDKYAPFGAHYYEATGHKTYLVCGASGGERISAFLPTDGEMWLYCKSVLGAAYDAVDQSKFNINVMSYIWIQGEQNKNTSVTKYTADFMTLHDAIMAGGLGLHFANCVISLPRSVNATNPVIAQKQIADECATVFIGCTASDSFTVENRLMQSDNMHYSPKGNNIIGEDLAKYCANMYYPKIYTNTELSLINVIPLLIIIGIVIATVSFMTKKE